MKQVTKEQFYNSIGHLDAIVSVDTTTDPYHSIFKLRKNRKILGKVISEYTDGIKNKYPIIKKYYLS